jgi:hypothetical protein
MATKGVENRGESGDTTHPTQPNSRGCEPLDGRQAPSTAHNGPHWLLLIMKLTSGSQFLGDSTPPMCSWRHLLPTKSAGGIHLSWQKSISFNMCVYMNSLHLSKVATSSWKKRVAKDLHQILLHTTY